jgi:hypothetical protein
MAHDREDLVRAGGDRTPQLPDLQRSVRPLAAAAADLDVVEVELQLPIGHDANPRGGGLEREREAPVERDRGRHAEARGRVVADPQGPREVVVDPSPGVPHDRRKEQHEREEHAARGHLVRTCEPGERASGSR